MSWLPEWLSRAITPESDAEKKANLTIDPQYYGSESSTIADQIYGGGIGAEFGSINDYTFNSTNVETPTKSDSSIGWWDQFLIDIAPKSYGERVADEVLAAPVGTALPFYDVEDFSSPNVYVEAKGAIKETLQNVGSFAGKSTIVIVILVFLAIAIYAAVPALLRR